MRTLALLQSPAWQGLLDRFDTLGRGAGAGLANLGVALAVLGAGWAVAAVVGRALHASLRALRFDEGMRRLLGSRADARHEPAAIAGRIAFGLVLTTAALLAVETLGYPLATSVAQRLAEVLPRIVTSAVLFVMGSLIAVLMGGVVRRFLESADVRSARLQGQLVTGVLTGFAALLALEQLGFAAQFVMAVGTVAVAAGGLGLALAFGLGCRELARDFVVEYLRSLGDDGPKRPE